jgi:hypothetical protein
VQLSQRIEKGAAAKAAVGPHQPDAAVRGQARERALHKLRGVVHTGRIAPAQPKIGDHLPLGKGRDQRAVTRLESLPGVADAHTFLLAVLMPQRPRVHIERVALVFARQAAHRPAMQSRQSLARAVGKVGEEPRQRRLARHRGDAQHLLRDGRSLAQIRNPRELVRTCQDAAEETQCDITRSIGMIAGRRVWQNPAQLRPKRALLQKLRPHHQSAMRRQALVSEADPGRLHPVFGAQIQPHRLVRLLGRR